MDTDTNINTNNTSKGSQEALETPLQPQVVSDGPVDDVSVVAPAGGVGEQKRKKWPWVVIFVVLGLIVIGGAIELIVWHSMQESANDNLNDRSSEEISVETVEYGTGVIGNPLVELSLDDEWALGVYGRINASGSPHAGMGQAYFWTDLLWNGGSDDVVLKIAFLNTEAGECKVKNRPSVDDFVGPTGECVDGVKIRRAMQEIFGREVPIEDGTVFNYGYFYDKDADEFYEMDFGGGGGPVPFVSREIYKIEKDNKRLYIYEYAAIMCMVEIDGNDEYWCQGIIYPQDRPHEARWYQVKSIRSLSQNETASSEVIRDALGDLIPEMITGPYAEFDENGNFLGSDWWMDRVHSIKLSDYADVVGCYKWTFVNDGAGNYVFEKLERIE